MKDIEILEPMNLTEEQRLAAVPYQRALNRIIGMPTRLGAWLSLKIARRNILDFTCDELFRIMEVAIKAHMAKDDPLGAARIDKETVTTFVIEFLVDRIGHKEVINKLSQALATNRHLRLTSPRRKRFIELLPGLSDMRNPEAAKQLAEIYFLSFALLEVRTLKKEALTLNQASRKSTSYEN